MIRTAVVVGASGYLGRRLLDLLGDRGVGTYSSRALPGLVPFDASRDTFADLQAFVGGGLTHAFFPYGAINPERCAHEPAATMAINVVSVISLMDAAMRAGVTPIFFSTDYVFDGKGGGFREADPQRPGTSYGAQKAAVEMWLATRPAPWIVTRFSKVVGPETGTHSVLGQWAEDIKAGKAQKAATDQVLSPGWVDDIARALVDLADRGATGIWHVAGAEAISRHALLMLLLEEVRKVDPAAGVEVTPCSIRDFPFAEPRPFDTSLNVSKLEGFLGWRFRTMRDLCAETARIHFGSR